VNDKARPGVDEVLREVRAALGTLAEHVVRVPDTNAALMDIFGFGGGGSWTNNNGWGTSRPLHEWYGVTVSGRGRVVKLHLGANNLEGG